MCQACKVPAIPTGFREQLLEDDDPMYAGSYYLADGVPKKTHKLGTVKQYKEQWNVREIRRCDAVKRKLTLIS